MNPSCPLFQAVVYSSLRWAEDSGECGGRVSDFVSNLMAEKVLLKISLSI
jgi:hypothetical protein